MYVNGPTSSIALDWVLTALPAIVLFATNYICRIPPSTGDVLGSFRPPPYVFGAIWAGLSLLTGISWTLAVHGGGSVPGACVTYGLLLVALCAWIVASNGSQGGASKQVVAYLFLPVFTLGFMAFAQGSVGSRVLLSPLLAWLLYAFAMTTGDILVRL